jgi:PST family polysaccharide transporter
MGDLEGAFQSPQRRVVVGVLSGFGNTFVVSVLGALATHEMAIHFGAGAYGIFVTALAFGGIVTNFTDLGLFPVLQRDIAREPSRASQLMSLVVGLRITLSAIAVPVAIAIGYLIYRHHSSSLKLAIVLVLLSAPLLGLLQIMSAYFSATSRLPTVAVIGIVKQVTFVVLVIVIIVERFSIVDCVAATLAGSIVATALSYFMMRHEVPLRFTVDLSEWKNMLVETTSVGLSSILGYFYLNADILILSVMVSSGQVGSYGVSYAVVYVFGAMPTLLSVAILPMIVHTADDHLDGVINAAIKYFAITGALMGTLGIVIGASVVRLYAGPHFDSAVLPLQILSSGQVVLFMTQGLSSISIARGHHQKLFQCSLIGLVLNVILNFALIPSFGIRGSAAATTLCELLLSVVMARIIRKDLGVTPHIFKASWRSALAAVVTCAALWHWYAHGKASSPGGLLLALPATAMFVLVLLLLRGIPGEVLSMGRGLLKRGKGYGS